MYSIIIEYTFGRLEYYRSLHSYNKNYPNSGRNYQVGSTDVHYPHGHQLSV